MALHREKRKYKTKSGKTAYRSVMVAAQGQPQMRLRLKQGGPAKSGAPRKGAILGAVVGALGGAAAGAVGGAALGVGHAKKAFVTPAWSGHHIEGPMTYQTEGLYGMNQAQLRRMAAGSGPHNPLTDPEFMAHHGGRVASHLGGVATRGALVGSAAGSILGAVGGAVSGYVAGRAAAAVQSRHSRGLKSMGPGGGSDHSAFAHAVGAGKAHGISPLHGVWSALSATRDGQEALDVAHGGHGPHFPYITQQRAHDLSKAFNAPATHVGTGYTATTGGRTHDRGRVKGAAWE